MWKYIFDNSTGNIKIVSDTESVSKAESDAESGSLHIHLYAGVYTELNAGLEKFPLFGLSQSSLSAKSLGSRSASNIRCNKASTVRYPGKKKKETQTESEDSISQSNCYSPVHTYSRYSHLSKPAAGGTWTTTWTTWIFWLTFWCDFEHQLLFVCCPWLVVS